MWFKDSLRRPKNVSPWDLLVVSGKTEQTLHPELFLREVPGEDGPVGPLAERIPLVQSISSELQKAWEILGETVYWGDGTLAPGSGDSTASPTSSQQCSGAVGCSPQTCRVSAGQSQPAAPPSSGAVCASSMGCWSSAKRVSVRTPGRVFHMEVCQSCEGR